MPILVEEVLSKSRIHYTCSGVMIAAPAALKLVSKYENHKKTIPHCHTLTFSVTGYMCRAQKKYFIFPIMYFVSAIFFVKCEGRYLIFLLGFTSQYPNIKLNVSLILNEEETNLSNLTSNGN